MEIVLFSKKFLNTSAWAVNSNDLESYIVLALFFNWQVLFCFRVGVANKSFMSRNPISALLMALESETIAASKYDKLKERVRGIGFWQKL